MPQLMTTTGKTPVALMVLVAAQIFCAAFFLFDVMTDFIADGASAAQDWHLHIEALACLSLVAAIVVEVRYLLWLLRRKAHLEHSVSVARAAVHDVIEAQFAQWDLTPSEADCANFLVKGFSITEIAALRGSAEGTIKSHLNAIYRKSGVAGRGELMSALLETLAHDKAA